MVFEKIKSLFGEEEKEEPEQPVPEPEKTELTFSNLENKIKEEKNRIIAETKETVQPILLKVSSLFEKIDGLKSDLNDAEPSEEVHPNIYKSTNEAKRLLLRKLKKAINKVEVPSDPSWRELIEFNRNLQDTVNLLKNARLSHGNQVANIFERHINNLIRLTDKLQNQSKELNTTLRKSNLKIEDLDDLMKEVSERKTKIENIKDLKSKLKNLNESREEVEEELKKSKESLKSLKKSSRHEELQKIKEKIENISKEQEKLKRKIESTISELDRPLRKMDKLIERDEHMVSSEVLEGINSYLEDPVQAVFNEEESLDKLKAMFKELKSLLKGKMELSEKERNKRLEEVEEILENKKVEKLKNKHDKLDEKLENLKEERESSSLLEKKSNLKKEIEEKESKLERLEEDIEDTNNELSQKEKELQNKNIKIRESTEAILGAKLKKSD